MEHSRRDPPATETASNVLGPTESKPLTCERHCVQKRFNSTHKSINDGPQN